MRVFTALGSARREGNTAKVLGWVEDALRAGGHEVDRANLYDYNIRACTGCNTCKLDQDAPGCIIEDDQDALLQRVLESDALIISSPLYCWGFGAQAKAFLDRCYALGKPVPGGNRSLISGKRIAFIITAGGGLEDNIDLVAATFPRLAGWHRLDNPGNLLVPNCARPADIPAQVQAEAQALAAKITE
jgi:multimeric flavodoxin WrbA